jgi:hypothetical protein
MKKYYIRIFGKKTEGKYCRFIYEISNSKTQNKDEFIFIKAVITIPLTQVFYSEGKIVATDYVKTNKLKLIDEFPFILSNDFENKERPLDLCNGCVHDYTDDNACVPCNDSSNYKKK